MTNDELIELLTELAQKDGVVGTDMSIHPAAIAADELRMFYEADKYARKLARQMHNNFYKDGSPEWDLLEDLDGVISQIDNMVTGLKRVEEERGLWARIKARLGINND